MPGYKTYEKYWVKRTRQNLFLQQFALLSSASPIYVSSLLKRERIETFFSLFKSSTRRNNSQQNLQLEDQSIVPGLYESALRNKY